MSWRLSSLVESETPTHEKAAVDALGNWLGAWAQDNGAEVKLHHQAIVGDVVECRWNTAAPGKPILLCCHMDTVHPLGTVEKRPTRIEEDILYGVGAYDMKAGIAIVQTVIEELHKTQQMPHRPLILLLVSDEEIGSPYSRPITEKLALESGLALVFEFCNYAEALVTERKGVGIFQLTALGRESHSGSAPDDGVNAIEEIAHHISKIRALSDPNKGTNVNPTIIRGGTAHNVIPGECDLVVNVRVRYHSEAERVYQALEAIADGEKLLPESELILTGEYMRPPMERDDLMQATFAELQRVSGEVLGEEGRGGGSDGSFSAALGVPTLDGLGASGEGAHTAHEQVFLPSLPRRAALLASVLTGWRAL